MTIDEFEISLKKLNIEFDENKLSQLNSYFNLLVEWNSKINLTTIIDEKEVYLKHFYDSLTITNVINLTTVNKICDIGTGAGFPGIVLKIFYPNLDVTLVESITKKTTFLKEVINHLNLDKIVVVNERIEEFAKNNLEIYDVVTARALAKTSILLEYSMPMIKINGYFIGLKGNIIEELQTDAFTLLNCKLVDRYEFLLPVENSVRNIIKVEKLQKTSNKYPRKYNEIKKKPL